MNKICIIGLGLLGGSIGKECISKNLAKKVLGFGRNSESLKKAKIVKVKNKVGRPKVKQSKKSFVKDKNKANIVKPKNTENLRLTKNQDQKPEIVKIKKQETEKKQ